MKKQLLQSLLTGLLGMVGSVYAEQYKSPQWNHCIRQFYDPKMYNWLAFENTCGERLKILYIANNPGYGGSIMTLSPGRHDSTGYSRSEMSDKRGFELFICPADYNPVDANNRFVTRVNSQFRCKKTNY